ncbi:MAG: YebC/PmpR family DNA-binding transcriptional regulator [Deltaproteobacteria bacterium]|nr:MAG: YebC/PmpR family DNA-binding transcriptional regulator [Deltaproteobacteria bacterium]
MGRDFENRKQAMFKRWDRMAKVFSRIAKDLTIAVKAGGPDPDSNPALRRVIQNARAANMPKDKVEAAIKRAAGQDAEDYQELVYEGYAPHGVAVLVTTATDNPTRTIANIRVHFNKGNGSLGTSGSVNYLFKRMGVFRIDAGGLDLEETELALIDHGLEDMEQAEGEKGETLLVARCDFNEFGSLQSGIETLGLEVVSAESEYVPLNTVQLDDAQVDDVLALVDRLEQDDDVQQVFHTLA